MGQLTRREFLQRSAVLAAAVGLGPEAAARALAAPSLDLASAPTTLLQTILQGAASRGPLPHAGRRARASPTSRGSTCCAARPTRARSASRRSLLYLGHLSDLHVIDAQSPGRIEPMIVQDHSAWGSAFHPHDPLSVHTTAAMVKAFADARYSPLTGAPMGAAIVTGDSADMHSHPRAALVHRPARRPHASSPASAGAHLRGRAGLAGGDVGLPPGRPDAAARSATTASRACRPCSPTRSPSPVDVASGCPSPWYAVYGNHDTLLLGTFDLSPQLHALAVGGQKSYTLEAHGDQRPDRVRRERQRRCSRRSTRSGLRGRADRASRR